jgi:hypothetical protein
LAAFQHLEYEVKFRTSHCSLHLGVIVVNLAFGMQIPPSGIFMIVSISPESQASKCSLHCALPAFPPGGPGNSHFFLPLIIVSAGLLN